MRRNNPRRDFGSQRHSLAQRHTPSQEAATDTCAGCSEPVDLKTQPWIITGGRKLVHYGGSFGQACMRKLIRT